MHEMANTVTHESCTPNRRIFFNVQLLGPYWFNVWAIIGPFLAISTLSLPEMAYTLTDESCTPNRIIFSNVQLLGLYWFNVWAIIGPFLVISTISLLIDA